MWGLWQLSACSAWCSCLPHWGPAGQTCTQAMLPGVMLLHGRGACQAINVSVCGMQGKLGGSRVQPAQQVGPG